MRRRRVLATLAFAVTSLAGCTSGPAKSGPQWGPPATEPGTPTEDHSTLTPTETTRSPGRGLQADFSYATTTATDAFAVTVTVQNVVEEPRTAILVVTWERDDESRVEERRVSLDPGGSTEFLLRFPEVGNLSFDWREA
jgi:hypothetical protein